MRAQPTYMAISSECRYRWLRLRDLNLLGNIRSVVGSRTRGGFWRTIEAPQSQFTLPVDKKTALLK